MSLVCVAQRRCGCRTLEAVARYARPNQIVVPFDQITFSPRSSSPWKFSARLLLGLEDRFGPCAAAAGVDRGDFKVIDGTVGEHVDLLLACGAVAATVGVGPVSVGVELVAHRIRADVAAVVVGGRLPQQRQHLVA